MTSDPTDDDPLVCAAMSSEMASREFAVRVVKDGFSLHWQQRMRAADGNLEWVFLPYVEVEPPT